MLTVPPVVALFPDGRLPVARLRTALRVYLALASAAVAWAYVRAFADLARGNVAVDPSSGDLADFNQPHGTLAWWYVAWAALVLTGLVAALAISAAKYRRADGDTRQQLRWFLFGASLVATALPPVIATSMPGFPSSWAATNLPAVYLTVTLAALPVTVTVGIIRYRLYDVNVVVSRTITYGALAAAITGLYLAVVGVAGTIPRVGHANLGVSVLATLLAAATFQPLRLRAQRLADRVVYGRRATPYEALVHLADQLAGSYDVNGVLARAARVLADATGAVRADVWLRSGDELRPIAAWPADAETPAAVAVDVPAASTEGRTAFAPVRHHGEVLGAISLTKRPGERAGEDELRLLGQLAAQAGLVLQNAKLAADLQRRLDELLASRQRLVSAQDEARRKVERDLHDGAQQQLIALNMKLSRLRAHLADDSGRRTLEQLQGDVDDTLESIRTLSRGIYPPLLADLGLTAALRAHVRDAPIPVVVESAVGRRCPREIEAAAYFCVLEALQNVHRHATASRAVVTITERSSVLALEISDDGRGFDPEGTTEGSGLTNMRDRAEALGGRVTLESAPGAGTTVRLELPLD